jgi:hypothetical protein
MVIQGLPLLFLGQHLFLLLRQVVVAEVYLILALVEHQEKEMLEGTPMVPAVLEVGVVILPPEEMPLVLQEVEVVQEQHLL